MANYLYNGVELPDINSVWTDKETYPYANVAGNAAHYYVLTVESGKMTYSDGQMIGASGVYQSYKYAVGDDGWTLLNEGEMVAGAIDEDPEEWFWTSVDILDTDTGEVYLAATEPVEVTYTTVKWCLDGDNVSTGTGSFGASTATPTATANGKIVTLCVDGATVASYTYEWTIAYATVTTDGTTIMVDAIPAFDTIEYYYNGELVKTVTGSFGQYDERLTYDLSGSTVGVFVATNPVDSYTYDGAVDAVTIDRDDENINTIVVKATCVYDGVIDDGAEFEETYAVTGDALVATANAIRAKTGGTSRIKWKTDGFAEAVEGISGGGGIAGGYTVTFMNGGVTHAVLSVVSGGYINAPSQPEKEGNPFLGWVDSNGDSVEFPYYPTADVTLNANYLAATIIGFTGLTAATGVLTLTDDGAGKGGYTTSTSGNYVSVSSPLDDMFPYNKIEEFEDSFGNVFVKFPKFYMKWVTDSSGVIDGWKISNVQVDEDYFIPDAFLKPDGSGEYNDYFALGKYEMSGSSAQGYSKSGKSCLVNITRATARAAARGHGSESNNYNGYQQEDIAMLTAYNFLCMMYYGTANIQTVYGGRTSSVSSWSSASVTGTCDGVDGMNGWNTSTDCVKMLGIENPFGNIHKWIDGIYFSGSTVYYQRYPQNFADSTANANALGFSRPTSSNYVSALKHGTTDATKSGVYASAASGSASTYYGDYSWYDSSGTVLYVGGRWSVTSYAGLWCLGGNLSASRSYSDVGARLSYRPL